MAANLHYDIQAKLYFNEFDLNTLDESALIYNHYVFGAVNIGFFSQTKTMFETREPLAQIRLNQIPEDLVKELSSNAYYLEIIISQGGVQYYKNFYNIIEASYDTISENRMGANLVYSDIILKSMLQCMIETDKTLTDVQVAVQSDVGYIKS